MTGQRGASQRAVAEPERPWPVDSWEAPRPRGPFPDPPPLPSPSPGKVGAVPERKIGLFSFLALSKASCPQGYLGPAGWGITH